LARELLAMADPAEVARRLAQTGALDQEGPVEGA
jgi:hypothetical protein